MKATFRMDAWFDEELGAGEVLQAPKTSNAATGATDRRPMTQ